jgi:hypothetical protein
MTLERRAILVDETMATADGSGFIPCVVIEGEPYLYPLAGNSSGARPWIWGPTIEDARDMARDANERMFGLDANAVLEITAAVRYSRQRPTNCDGDDCIRRDCELHYMFAPLALKPLREMTVEELRRIARIEGYSTITRLDKTDQLIRAIEKMRAMRQPIHFSGGLGFLTACDLETNGREVTNKQSAVTCGACRVAMSVARSVRLGRPDNKETN